MRRYALATAVTVVFALSAAVLLFAPPPIGIADNGDYSRMMQWIGAEHTAEDRSETMFNWFRRYYRVDAGPGLGMPSSSAVFVLAAYFVHRLAGGGVFDIFMLGAVHLTAMAFAVFLLVLALQRGGARPAATLGAALLLVYILVEPGYLVFFNSFYSESAVIIGTTGLAAALILCRAEPGHSGGWRWTVALVAMILLLGTSKQQNLLAGVLALASLLLTGPRRARTALLIAVASTAVAVPLLWWVSASLGAGRYDRNITIVNKFHTAYYGVAMVADDPPRVIERLGLPPASAVLVGKTAFAAESKAFIDSEAGADALRRMSRARILLQYLTDPAAFGAALSRTGGGLQSSWLDYLGNFQQSVAPDRPRAQAVTTWSWSRWRDQLLSAWPGGLPVFALILLVLVIVTERRGQHVPVAAGLIFLLAQGLTQMGVVVLGDGFYEQQKHLGFARFALDLSLPLAVVYVAALWHRRDGRPAQRDSEPG